MSPAYAGNSPGQNGEKCSPASQSGQRANAGTETFGLFQDDGISSGWTGSRIANCFASFSMCPPCSPFETQPGTSSSPREQPALPLAGSLTDLSAYQPLPVSEPYHYDDRRLLTLDTSMVSVQPQCQGSLIPTPITPDPTGLFACDDPALVNQYLSNYPPLQPAQVTETQPAPGKEEMVYPDTSPLTKYDGVSDSPPGLGPPVIQSQPYMTTSPLHTSPMSGTYPAVGEPSSYQDHKAFMNPLSTLHSRPGFDVKEGGSLGAQEGISAVLDFFPPQRTLPAKRGPFKDQDQREKTARTRKIGSCIRCRMQRIRVSTRRPMYPLCELARPFQSCMNRVVLTPVGSVTSIPTTKKAPAYHAKRSRVLRGCTG